MLPDLPDLNHAEADRAVAIFDKLRLPDVVGMPRLKEAGGDWFRDIVRAIHGSYDPATNTRHIREAFILAPKKSSKTSYSAALMVTSLMLNRRPRGELIMIAATQQITALAYNQCVGMIQADPYLSQRFHVREHLKTIVDRTNDATLSVRSFNPSVLTGIKPVMILVDELHIVSAMSEADRVMGQARGGMISQTESCMVIITTQSERPPAGVFKTELRKARGIRDGRIKGAMLPILYELPPTVDWRDPSNWWMISPNRNLSMQVERLVADYEGAKDTNEGELRRWASQHLNVEIGITLADDRWAGADYWERQGDPKLTLDDIIDRSDVLTVGIDGGGLDDLLGLAVIGRDRDTREWLHWGRAWAHPSVMEQRKSEAGRLGDFAADGDLIMVKRMGEDIEQIADLCESLQATGKLSQVGLDPMGVGALVDALAERGVTCVIGIPQGVRLNGAIKTTERKLADGTLHHCAQPLMAWNVGNAKVEIKGSATTISKQNSGTAKIDALVALLAAATLMSSNPVPPGVSIFDQPGLW